MFLRGVTYFGISNHDLDFLGELFAKLHFPGSFEKVTYTTLIISPPLKKPQKYGKLLV